MTEEVFNLTRLDPATPDDAKLNTDKIAPGLWMNLAALNIKLSHLALNAGSHVAPESIKAVPDPWAHPRAFAAALLDTKHSLHEFCKGQWRWLLALIALSKQREHDYRLEFPAIELAGNTSFDKMLTGLLPKKHVWSASSKSGPSEEENYRTGWDKIGLIRLEVDQHNKSVIVGLLNPACLVCSGRRFPEVNGYTNIDWIKDGISDPTNKLATDEKRLIWRYVRMLGQNLKNVLGDTSETNWGTLSNLLDEFAYDLAGSKEENSNWRTTDFQAKDDQLEPTFKLEEPNDHASCAELAPLYKPLLRRPYDELPDTDCQIHNTHLILLDKELAQTLSRSPSRVMVWKNIPLSAALEDRARIENDQSFRDGNYRLVTPDDLVTDKVFTLTPGENVNFRSHGSSLSQALLPITPLALSFLHRDTIANSLRFDRGTVTLSVPIGDGTKMHRVNKKIRSEAVAYDGDEISIWPDFRHDKWRDYYARILPGTGAGQYNIAPLYAVAWVDASEKQWRAIAPVNRVVRSEKPVDVVLCAATKDDQSEYAGLLVLDPPDPKKELKEPLTLQVRVAIDFGTTGTIAAAAPVDGEGYSIIEFHDRIVQPLQPSVKNPAGRAYDLMNFFPGAVAGNIAQKMPVLSAWRPDKIWAGHGEEGMPLFLTEITPGNMNATLGFLRTVKTNLKWGPNLRPVTFDYLGRLGVMIRAELCVKSQKASTWLFTYPRALPNEELFEDEVKKQFDPVAFTKEDVACVYSAFNARAGQDTIIILDIGGGTTDASILQRGDEGRYDWKWLGSLKLAGMNFFTRTLTETPELLDWLGLDTWKDITEGAETIDKPFRLELLMNNETLDLTLNEKWGWRDHDDYKDSKPFTDRLVAAGACFMAGIAWYLGKVAAFSPQVEPDRLSKVAFVLCGRGSRFPLRMKDDARFAKTFALFNTASGASAAISVAGDLGRAKQEVVTGALAAEDFDQSLLGEQVDADRTAYHVAEVTGLTNGAQVSAKANDRTVPTITVAEFDAFMNALKSTVGLNYSVDDLEGRIGSLPQKSANDVTKEPAFIVALRWLVHATASGDKSVTWKFI